MPYAFFFLLEEAKMHENVEKTKCWAAPVEAVLQSFVDSGEVSGVSHHSAVQGVVPQVDG